MLWGMVGQDFGRFFNLNFKPQRRFFPTLGFVTKVGYVLWALYADVKLML